MMNMILIETTEWSVPNIPNHVYIANQSKDKIEGYFNVVKQELMWFSKPQRFDRRYRTFKTFDFIFEDKTMSNFQFTTVMNAINNLPKNTNYAKVLKDEYGFEASKDKNTAKFQLQYAIQGTAKELKGKELSVYINKSVADLFDRFPHLKEDIVMENTATETVQVKTVKTGAKATKTAAKTAKPKKAAKVNPHAVAEAIVSNTRIVSTRKITSKKTAAKHADGTIFFRADRNKFVAMLNGKQEAARDSIEKCMQFLNKKGFDMSKVVVLD